MPDQKPNAILLYHQCGKCGGTGKFTPPELPEGDCPGCNGAGYNVHYHIDMNGIISQLTDIEGKVDALEDLCDSIKDLVEEL